MQENVPEIISTAHQKALTQIGNTSDEDINLFDSALVLSSIWNEGISLGRFRNHSLKLQTQLSGAIQKTNGTADERAESIQSVMQEQNGYFGAKNARNDVQNADIIRTIERRTGSSMVLSLLTAHVARALGWSCMILDFPKYALCRLDYQGLRIILDPSEGFIALNASDLRARIKSVEGAQAELTTDHLKPLPNRDVLTRLQNTIKYRQIEIEAYDDALKTVTAMRLIAPDEYRVLLDQAVLFARLFHTQKAIETLEEYIERTPDHFEREAAKSYLYDLQTI